LNKKHYAFFLKKNRKRKKQNPIARALNFFTPQVIPNKKRYDRKKSRILDRGGDWDLS
jgi:hypothetical protein